MTPFDDDFNNQDNSLENNNFANHIFNHQVHSNLPDPVESKPQATEVHDTLLRRVSNSYQVLAAAVIRANQAKRDLEARINETQQQIAHHHQRLAQISEQIVEEQTECLPQDELSTTQQINNMSSCIHEEHYHNLTVRLNELSRANYSTLPAIIDSMRVELDLIEIRAQKIRILESLREAYVNHQYFQDYFQQADEEFRKLFNQY